MKTFSNCRLWLINTNRFLTSDGRVNTERTFSSQIKKLRRYGGWEQWWSQRPEPGVPRALKHELFEGGLRGFSPRKISIFFRSRAIWSVYWHKPFIFRRSLLSTLRNFTAFCTNIETYLSKVYHLHRHIFQQSGGYLTPNPPWPRHWLRNSGHGCGVLTDGVVPVTPTTSMVSEIFLSRCTGAPSVGVVVGVLAPAVVGAGAQATGAVGVSALPMSNVWRDKNR